MKSMTFSFPGLPCDQETCWAMPGGIIFQEGELIEIEAEIGRIEIFCQSFVGSGAGFGETIQMNVGRERDYRN